MGNKNGKGGAGGGGGGGGGKGLLQISTGGKVNLDIIPYEEDLEEFEEKKILEWDSTDVLEWVNAIEFGDLVEPFRERVKTGEELFKLGFQDPVFNTMEERRKKAFFVYLYHVKQCVKPRKAEEGESKFSMKFHRVCQKIFKGVGMEEFKFKHMEAHCSVLSNRHKIKQYLLDHKKQENEKVKVKLIITESIFNPKEQLLRKIVSPIVSMIPQFSPEFGLFHSAILLGSFYLHWTDSELVIPKKIESGAAFISIDTDPITIEDERDFDEMKEKIALVIERWNSYRTYSQMPKKREEGNCQDFIFDLCKELEINLQIEDGSFGEYLKKLKKKGAYKIQFKPSPQFEADFKLDEYPPSKEWKRTKNGKRMKIDFETHKDLDDFLYYCYTSNTLAIKKYRDEYRLLKSFDRAFWLRHLKDKGNDLWKPAPESSGRSFGRVSAFRCGCPFEDPRCTGSYDG